MSIAAVALRAEQLAVEGEISHAQTTQQPGNSATLLGMAPLLTIKGLTLRRDDGTGSAIFDVRAPGAAAPRRRLLTPPTTCRTFRSTSTRATSWSSRAAAGAARRRCSSAWQSSTSIKRARSCTGASECREERGQCREQVLIVCSPLQKGVRVWCVGLSALRGCWPT